MNGEGVEGIIVMLVIIFAIFHMVKKKSGTMTDADLFDTDKVHQKKNTGENKKND